jgi:UDP-sulfoquinovose synthase
MKSKNIIIFGGDGFCGWPTALYLSKAGYNITIVDNLSRRKIDVELECQSLTPIASITNRRAMWQSRSGNVIHYANIDVHDNFHRLLTMINEIKPLAVIHFAEQRAAPYSMKSPWHKRYTVNNNLNATNNILDAIVESGLDIHVVHLGTAGYYGYSSVGMKIPEGYLKVKVDVDGEEKDLEIMYPPNPGSIYHLTKCQDALFFHYYNKNDALRITDLHQGIVYGCQTDETIIHEDLINRFDYDGDYGTVLNRFAIQAAIGHPLTIYGTGGQTRAFIHISDTVKCIKLAIENPPAEGDRVRVLNQAAECLNVHDLADTIKRLTGAEIRYYKNPRNEDPKNELKFANEGFKSLGWEPKLLEYALIEDVMKIAHKWKDRVDIDKVIPTSLWDKNKEVDKIGAFIPEK